MIRELLFFAFVALLLLTGLDLLVLSCVIYICKLSVITKLILGVLSFTVGSICTWFAWKYLREIL